MLKDFQKSHYHLLKTANTAAPSPQIDSECGLRQNPPHKIPKNSLSLPKISESFFIYTPITLPQLGGNPHTLNLKVRRMQKKLTDC